MKKQYYYSIDIIRILACIAVFFYHIGFLKGGYLAVCIFFVLSGYLSFVSISKEKKFSLKDYYFKKFKSIYLPYLLTIFFTVGLISVLKIDYLNLKPEVTSLLFGYNNYWQLNANLDYFVRLISSPFMHFWYIAILLQFELLFPVFYYLSKKTKKIFPFVLGILTVLSAIVFCIHISKGNIMTAYYDSFSRFFSLGVGLLTGYILSSKKHFIFKSKIIFPIYMIVFVLFFIFIDFQSSFFSAAMILVSIMTARMIDYGTVLNTKFPNEKLLRVFSKISYPFYLVQYPIIFFLQQYHLSNWIFVPLVILGTSIFSVLLYSIFTITKKEFFKSIKFYILVFVTLFSLFGFYTYVISQDHTKEMQKLHSDLEKSKKEMMSKQKENLEKMKKEQEEWNQTLNDFELSDEELKEKVHAMPIVGIGDSIMELALKQLYEQWPNGYFDAVENRTAYATNDILIDLKNRGLLGDVVLFSIGTNGSFTDKYTIPIMETLGDRTVFWINATNADYDTFNGQLENLASRYPNIHIIDWVSACQGHPEYLISDKVHPTVYGCGVYADFMFQSIFNYYKNESANLKEAKIREHQELENKKITFIGNDLLLGMYDSLQETYPDSFFLMDSKYTYNLLKKELKKSSLNHNLVFLMDSTYHFTNKQLNELSSTYSDSNLYIVDMSGTLESSKDNLQIIDFSKEIKNHKDYLEVDGVHLSDKGMNALEKKIDSIFSK